MSCSGHVTRDPIMVSQRGEHLVMEIHTHPNVSAAEEVIRAAILICQEACRFRARRPMRSTRRCSAASGEKPNGTQARLADMDAQGVDVQAISPDPGQYYYFTQPELRPYLAAAEEIGVLLFVHPLGFTHGPRLSEHYLNNFIGNPLQSSIALSHLIFGGVLDELPRLELCVAHGGGYLPTDRGRMGDASRARKDCRQHLGRAPSEALRQVWFGTLVFDREQFAYLVQSHGADRLCMGTDFPSSEHLAQIAAQISGVRASSRA